MNVLPLPSAPAAAARKTLRWQLPEEGGKLPAPLVGSQDAQPTCPAGQDNTKPLRQSGDRASDRHFNKGLGE
jgi:hypothetical protein